MRIVCVAGARPNFMKVKPVVDALEAHAQAVTLVHTGQHYDVSMSQVFFDELRLRAPDYQLEVGSGSHSVQTARVLTAFEPVVTRIDPDVVVVFGDVNSTFACALTAAQCGVPVAHVEAGLRSGDWSMPEEVNRVVTDRVSDYLFAPSPDAVDNLRAEGYTEDQIHLVGNVMVDTLCANIERARARSTLDHLGVKRKTYGLVTMHRPSSVDKPSVLAHLVDVLGVIAEDCPLIFPVHPRTRARLVAAPVPPGLRLIEPIGYLDFLALEEGAQLVLTDSGGVQEETTMLGVPCLTLRDRTERPITVTHGTNRVVGHDRELIISTARAVLAGRVAARRPPLWDGHAAPRIAAVLIDGGGPASVRAPKSAQPADTSPE